MFDYTVFACAAFSYTTFNCTAFGCTAFIYTIMLADDYDYTEFVCTAFVILYFAERRFVTQCLVLIFVFLFEGGNGFVVFSDDFIFKNFSEFCVDRMNYITICVIRILFARHNDKIPLARINNLYIMNGKSSVKRYRRNRFHRTVVIKQFPKFNVRDRHYDNLLFSFDKFGLFRY